jgi:hypothetical protein
MDNSYFIYTSQNQNIEIERFHICSWEFNNNSSFIEFGCEIRSHSIADKRLIQLELFIPWLDENCITEDFYDKLKVPENSRFIFNDSVTSSSFFDGGRNKNGVIHKFLERENLCILPVDTTPNYGKKILTLLINLELFGRFEQNQKDTNIYFRFSVKPKKALIATRKNGITKSTILYDIKLNQQRNIPENLIDEILHMELCKVNKCFCFNIIPNSYDLVFFDPSTLKNVRTLEYQSFKEYLGDDRLKEDDLIVVFNKKTGLDSYAFFSIFSKEYLGTEQLTIALIINLIAGLLLFWASMVFTLDQENKSFSIGMFPFVFWIAVVLIGLMIFYFIIKRKGWITKIKNYYESSS